MSSKKKHKPIEEGEIQDARERVKGMHDNWDDEEVERELSAVSELSNEETIQSLTPEMEKEMSARMLALVTACCIHINDRPVEFNAAVFLFHLEAVGLTEMLTYARNLTHKESTPES
jgi:chromatin segregation and condensation protein Rec8/ScpA/Scc1 (kleisin family)